MEFAAYLEAKFRLDERSLNPRVRELWNAAWRDRAELHCLDLGSGTGATIRRLLDTDSLAALHIVAVERDAGLLDLARRQVRQWLGERGFEHVEDRHGIAGRRGEKRVRVELVCSDLLEFEPAAGPESFDAIIAHHVMDLLPLASMTTRIAAWLRPTGLFYATLNYDGQTTLFPQYSDDALENRILAWYDESMENRRVNGEISGGARSGKRLHAALLQSGLRMVTYGSSDWNLIPVRGVYIGFDSLCLRALLDMIRDQMRRSGQLTEDELDGWHRERVRQADLGELGLVTYQLDFLAEKA